MKTIFFLILLIATTTALKYKQTTFTLNNQKMSLAQMLQTVQDEHSSANSVRKVMNNLKGMIEELKVAQDAHQKVATDMEGQCIEEDAFRAKEINDAQVSLNDATAKYNQCVASKNEADAHEPEMQADLNEYQQQLDDATAQREAERAAFAVMKADLEQGITFVQDFINSVNERLGSLGFIQKSSEKLLLHSAKMGLIQKTVPVLIALSQYQVGNANDYSVGRQSTTEDELKNALNALLEAIKKELADRTTGEEQKEAAYQVLKGRLEVAIAQLKVNLENLRVQREEMIACIARESVVMNDAEAKISRNTNLKESAAAMCSEFAAEFVHATNSRLAEVQTVKEIVAICKERFDQLPAGLVEYLEQTEDGWLAYVNSTQFKAYEAYVQKTTADNEAGRALNNGENLI